MRQMPRIDGTGNEDGKHTLRVRGRVARGDCGKIQGLWNVICQKLWAAPPASTPTDAAI